MSTAEKSPRASRTLKSTGKMNYVRTQPESANKSQTMKGNTKNQKPMKMTAKEIQKDKRYKNYEGLDIQKLRALKDEQIEQLNFDESEYIEAIIQMLQTAAPVDATAIGAKWLTETLEDLIDDYKQNLDKINSEFKDKELAIRENENTVFSRVHDRHILEIEEVETAREVQLLNDTNSVCGRAIDLQKQAKTLAKANDFDGARQQKRQSEIINERYVERRKENTNIKYDNELKKLLDCQENQLMILLDRLNKSLEDNNSRKNASIKELQKQYQVFYKSQLQRLIVDGQKQLPSTEQKSTFVTDINIQYRRIILDAEKRYNLPLSFLL